MSSKLVPPATVKMRPAPTCREAGGGKKGGALCEQVQEACTPTCREAEGGKQGTALCERVQEACTPTRREAGGGKKGGALCDQPREEQVLCLGACELVPPAKECQHVRTSS